MKATSIAIIGAGFSGTLLSLHLLRKCPPGTRITLIERDCQFGPGQAYATGNPGHLLNVPAGRMSAFHDRPLHFLEWLGKCPPEVLNGAAPGVDAFVPRRLFGAYIRALLNEEMTRPERGGQLTLLRRNVVGIDRSTHPLLLIVDRGAPIEADLAVLAVGNFPPEPVPVADLSFYDSEFYKPDPWAANALADLDPTAPVLLIGTGLTMIDTVISLLDQGHHGPIAALSRRGLLPQRHQAGPALPADSYDYPDGITSLARFVGEKAAQAVASGNDWRPVIDALRPFTQDVWQAMSPSDRARFLRHLRPWWDVHRHRMPGVVADRIQAARERQQLRVLAGRIRAFRPQGKLVEVAYRPRGAETPAVLRAARVINCAGPGADYDRIADPLVRSLLREGTARPDPLRLGLDVTSTCALRLGSGAISRRLFAVGPVTKGAFWEITAVPDIRRQCELLAQHLATFVTKPESPSSPAPIRLRAGALEYSI
jgi:uncharacterized NAD(P)/FAD-binding protein YdhS